MQRILLLVALPLLLGACGILSPIREGVISEEPIPVDPLPGGERITGEFFVDSTIVRVAESSPAQVFVDVEGRAPTPCHTLVWEVLEAEGSWEVTIMTEIDMRVTCVKMPEPHAFTIELGEAPDLPVEVWVNGTLVHTVEG